MKSYNVKLARGGGGYTYRRLTEAQLAEIKITTEWELLTRNAWTPWVSYSLTDQDGSLVLLSALDDFLDPLGLIAAGLEGAQTGEAATEEAATEEAEIEEAAIEESAIEEHVMPELWSVISTSIYSDGSIEIRRQSGDESKEVQADAGAEIGSFKNKFAFDYSHEAPGVPDALIGMAGAQAPGYDAIHGENWLLPLGWVLKRGLVSGEMYLSGYDENGTIIFMVCPSIASTDRFNTYRHGDPKILRPAST